MPITTLPDNTPLTAGILLHNNGDHCEPELWMSFGAGVRVADTLGTKPECIDRQFQHNFQNVVPVPFRGYGRQTIAVSRSRRLNDIP